MDGQYTTRFRAAFAPPSRRLRAAFAGSRALRAPSRHTRAFAVRAPSHHDPSSTTKDDEGAEKNSQILLRGCLLARCKRRGGRRALKITGCFSSTCKRQFGTLNTASHRQEPAHYASNYSVETLAVETSVVSLLAHLQVGNIRETCAGLTPPSTTGVDVRSEHVASLRATATLYGSRCPHEYAHHLLGRIFMRATSIEPVVQCDAAASHV
jgi:hypothetical protein